MLDGGGGDLSLTIRPSCYTELCFPPRPVGLLQIDIDGILLLIHQASCVNQTEVEFSEGLLVPPHSSFQ